ncbi:MAG: non-canonical purine NTP pyrophosphatase [Gaiellaceae bacterium]
MAGLTAQLASRNANKLRELSRVLEGWELGLLGADGYPPEEGPTYYDNALAKALFGRTIADSEAWVLGEDSGIEVDGLGGRPGAYSARFGAGEPVERLLDELREVEGDGRRARYVCELVCLTPDGEEFRGTGVLEGRIAEEPRGSEGFGYDPIFIPDGEVLTVAELGNEWKAENSHRARAARALLHGLREAGSLL